MKKILKKILNPLRFAIIIYHKGIHCSDKKNTYQKRFVNFKITSEEKVLDIGSGGEPFPYATHLVDKYPQTTRHRHNQLKTNNLTFTQADVEQLPFKDKSFDFIYCSHVLEHVENPARSCDQIMRVGKRGYIETPTRMSDILFNFTKIPNFHKWHVTMIGNKLFFFEYQNFEKVDTTMNEFFYMSHSMVKNPIIKFYRKHKNLFSNMFMWHDKFDYYVFDKQGKLINQT